MKINSRKFSLLLSSIAVMFLLNSCEEEGTSKPKKNSINAFSMRINGGLWQPYQDAEDPCEATYIAHYGHLGEDPMYTIYAYNDPRGISDASSETFLRTRIMNVRDTGTYVLDGSYKNDFDSYFVFVSNKDSEEEQQEKKYINEPQRSSFTFHVEKIFPVEGMFSLGFAGSFEGVMYNEANSKDSLIVEQGRFVFNMVNYDDHCGK